MLKRHGHLAYAGGIFLEEKMRALLEKYPLEVLKLHRGRGAWMCETDQGLKLIRPYKGSPKRLTWEVEMKKQLKERGCLYIDQIICNQDGEYMTKDIDEESYIVSDWFSGRECNTRDAKDVLKAIVHLADMHLKMRGMSILNDEMHLLEMDEICKRNLMEEMCRRLREFRMIRNYICRKKQKNEFDRKFLKIYEQYLEEGNRAVKILYDMGYETLFSDTCQNIDLCHGDFHQHNLIMQRDGIALVRFDHMHIGVQVSDLYVFMRKILEKNHWNIGLGMAMLDAYKRIVPMDYKEMRCLYALLVFPEKLWKITNRYSNTRKSWMSAQNMAKLDKWIREEDERASFLKHLDIYCEETNGHILHTASYIDIKEMDKFGNRGD